MLYIARRIGQSLCVLFGLSLLIFVIARVMPGDPARVTLGPLATAEQIQRLTEKMRLNEPIYVQYYVWLRSALTGDLGKSTVTKRDIIVDIRKFLPATLELVFLASLIALVIGQVIGVLAGRYRNSWVDNVARVISYFGIVTPPFVFAILFLLLFSYGLGCAPSVGRLSLGIKPPTTRTGFLVLDSLIAGNFPVALDALEHLLLPAMSLAMVSLAQESRITRASLSENLMKDYVTAHIGYGIPRHVIMFKYLLKPSITPTVAIMGLDLVCVLANAFLVEIVFNWPGFSAYGVSALLHKDLNAIIAVILVVGCAFTIVNILVDILVMTLDPRIRLRRQVKQ